MKKTIIKVIDTSTLKGLKEAENLQAKGYKAISIGFGSNKVKMQKEVIV